MFPDADKVIIDRKENRHAAFGLGIHRCVGSNLARMEMTVAIEEWLKRMPKFSLARRDDVVGRHRARAAPACRSCSGDQHASGCIRSVGETAAKCLPLRCSHSIMRIDVISG